jgi:hypothetical protein
MSEKMKDSDETREEKFEERILKYAKLKEKVVNRMDNELKLSDLVEAERIAREKMPIKVKWEVKEKNSMTTVPQWIIEAMIEFTKG